jgi:hypothetical protein
LTENGQYSNQQIDNPPWPKTYLGKNKTCENQRHFKATRLSAFSKINAEEGTSTINVILALSHKKSTTLLRQLV